MGLAISVSAYEIERILGTCGWNGPEDVPDDVAGPEGVIIYQIGNLLSCRCYAPGSRQWQRARGLDGVHHRSTTLMSIFYGICTGQNLCTDLPAQQRVTCGKQQHKTHRAGLPLRVLTHMIAYIWK